VDAFTQLARLQVLSERVEVPEAIHDDVGLDGVAVAGK